MQSAAKSRMPAVFAVACLLVASLAWAQPGVAPGTVLPGFDREQSGMLRREAAATLERALTHLSQRAGVKALVGDSYTCALAQFLQGTVQAATVHMAAQLTPAELGNVAKALRHLEAVVQKHCGRPPGGGLGTGNEGDRLVHAFVQAQAPMARSRLEELRAALGERLGLPEGSMARDALLVAAALLAGAVALPSLAVP